jgi:hypothetical protein
VRPGIRLIYDDLGDSPDDLCPLNTGLYQPGCSTVAVNYSILGRQADTR